MKSFNEFLAEAKDKKTVVAAFGRFNPPSIGHAKLFDAMSGVADKENAGTIQVYGSHSQDPKKNPLDFKTKMGYLEFYTNSPATKIMKKSNVNNPFALAEELAKDGYKHIILVAGSDRIAEYQRAEKYALANGAESFKVVSAGERDPDADGAEGMSASKLRKAAADGDFTSFSIGTGMSKDLAKDLYDDVRKGMGIK